MEISLTLPAGYRVLESQVCLSHTDALRKLRSKGKKRITSAFHHPHHTVLTMHKFRCPHCGKDTPAYDPGPVSLSTETLAQWDDGQLSFFEADQVIQLQMPSTAGMLRCPLCGFTSQESDNYHQVTLSDQENSVTVSREISGFAGLMELRWVSELSLLTPFPLFEKTVFDFEKHECYLCLCNPAGKVLAEQNITYSQPSTEDSPLVALIEQNRVLRRKILGCFRKRWQLDFPFSTADVTLHQLVMGVRFTGFPLRFYDAVPYYPYSVTVPNAFMNLPFQKPDEAMAYLKSSSIPYIKSIKRCFAKDSGLFFFLPQIETFYRIFKDPNLLCRLLHSVGQYEILCGLHRYPGIADMLTDYAAARGAVCLLNELQWDYVLFQNDAVDYCAMGPEGRAEMQKRWGKRRPRPQPWEVIPQKTTYSVPTTVPHLPNCRVGRYRYRWLRSRNQYQMVGKEMENCLQSWSATGEPVAVIMRGHSIAAAISLGDKCISTALQPKNIEIDPRSPLAHSILQFCRIFHLDPPPFGKEDDLPFDS